MKRSSVDSSKSVSILGRDFKMRLLSFSNGCFLSISEGSEERIGSLTLSMKIHDKVEHTAVIPERRAGILSSILSEMAANLTRGIAIVSLYVLNGLSAELAKDLLKEVRDFLNTADKPV
ncbi:MAG: hypothetical protein ACE5KU_03085 [Nitrososphaerales archaeon]